jgi:hypothetical protein
MRAKLLKDINVEGCLLVPAGTEVDLLDLGPTPDTYIAATADSDIWFLVNVAEIEILEGAYA